MTEETPHAPTVALCMPSYGIMDGQCSVTIGTAFSEMCRVWKNMHGPTARAAWCYIPRVFAPKARNLIVEEALKINADWTLWIDDDMCPPSDIFERLMARNLPIVSGLYCKKNELDEQLVYFLTDSGEWGRMVDPPPNGLIRCHGSGMGCVLISGKVLREAYDATNGRPFVYSEDEMEDLYFFRQVHALGYQFHMDTTVKCIHVGRREFMPKTVDAPTTTVAQSAASTEAAPAPADPLPEQLQERLCNSHHQT